jgi:malto-oligosyltrehalose trehalohydrolase
MRRVHLMPFGAQVTTQGVEFRLWAPAAHQVDLLLCDAAVPQVRPMLDCGQGWFARTEPEVRAGAHYRFRIDMTLEVPDPASRWNDADAEGASVVVDPARFDWGNERWLGRAWHEAVIYELHIGTFTPEGTFLAAIRRLDHLRSLGVTMLELMPIGDFPGRRGWGYDGVLPFAPDSAYGSPDDLKQLIKAAHARGLGVLLDVVYNHFGPQGNFLASYAPQFSAPAHTTPWGAAMNFDRGGSDTVRQYFIHNALYWIEEFAFDGLRLDAVHAIHDGSAVHFVADLARSVRTGPGRSRPVHLIAENHANDAGMLGTPQSLDRFDAQWNDDVHHCLHVILTGESNGYYGDFAGRSHEQLARALAEGFVFQGELSRHDGCRRGSASAHLPPTAFINFLQNHDQIGNRPRGERLINIVSSPSALRAAAAIVLLAPSIPMLFMGEEWGTDRPFPYFCDFNPELAASVREGRREEFAGLSGLAGGSSDPLPDPTAPETFESARLDWSRLRDVAAAEWLEFHRSLLAIRRAQIMPLIPGIRGANHEVSGAGAPMRVSWSLADGSQLVLLCNLRAQECAPPQRIEGHMLYSSHPLTDTGRAMDPWCVIWLHHPQPAALAP